MNTKTTLLGVLGLVTVAGAGYFYTNSDQDMSKMPQQIGQYLPEAVLDYLPESFSPETVEAPAAAVAHANGLDQAENHQAETTVAETESQIEHTDAAESTETEVEPANEQEATHVAVESANDATEKASEAVDADIMSEIEQSVAEVSNEAGTVNKDTETRVINDPETSKEALALKQQLAEVNSKLADLDKEKETLEERFQKVLKQNRTLALKLKEIDEQLKASMQ